MQKYVNCLTRHVQVSDKFTTQTQYVLHGAALGTICQMVDDAVEIGVALYTNQSVETIVGLMKKAGRRADDAQEIVIARAHEFVRGNLF